jgi:hypothetical protein
MSTTTVVSDNTATIVREDVSRFRWGPVIAGAVIATAITFLLVSFGSGLGLALSSAHSLLRGASKPSLRLEQSTSLQHRHSALLWAVILLAAY